MNIAAGYNRRYHQTTTLLAAILLALLALTACGEEQTPVPNREADLPKDRVLALSNRDGWPDLYTVDLSGKVTGRLTESAAAEYGAVWSPDGRKVAFTELNGDQAAGDYARNRQLVVIDADGRNRKVIAPDGFNPVWSPDSRRLLFTRLNRAASHSDTTGRAVANIAAPPRQIAPGATPSPTSGQAARATATPEPGGGSFIISTTPDNEATPTTGRQPVAPPPPSGLPGFGPVEPTPAPLTNPASQTFQASLYVTGLEGGPAGLLAADAVAGVWSPDGSRIAYIGGNNVLDQKRTLNLVQADGNGRLSLSERAKLTDLDVLYTAWSPDGAALAFTATDTAKNKTSLYRLAPDSGGARRLADYDGSAREIMSLIWAYADYYNPAARLRLGPAWSPNSRLLAFSDGSARLSVIDASTGAARYFPVGSAALGQDKDSVLSVSWLPDNRRLVYDRASAGRNTLQAQASSYIYDFFEETLETLDTANKNTLTLLSGPGAAFLPACCGTDLLGAGNPSATPAASPGKPAATPAATGAAGEGKLVFVSGIGQRQLIVHDLKTGARATIAAGLFKLIDFNLAPGGNRLVYVEVGERFNASLYLAGMDGKGKRKLSEGGGNPEDLSYITSWSPDGKQLAFQTMSDDPNLKGGLYTVEVDDSGSPPRLITSKNVSAFAWSPDSRQIAYKVDASSYELWIAPANGGSEGSRLAAIGRFDPRYSSLGKGLAWSPDGRYLAMSGVGSIGYGAIWQLWLITPQGKIEEQPAYYISRLIGFTPDSSRLLAIMATSGQSSTVQAYTLPVAGRTTRGWRSYDRGAGPQIAVDGQNMAYFTRALESRADGSGTLAAGSDAYNRLVVLNFANGATRAATLDYTPYYAFKARFFAWEPSGKAVAFYQNNTIYLATPQGTGLKQDALGRAFAVDRLGWAK